MRTLATAAFSILLPMAALADGLPQTVELSGSLVEEIARNLSAQPYQNVAQILLRLQNEVQHQPTQAPAPQPPTPEKKGK